jgi:molybdopterin adenylyltransferase
MMRWKVGLLSASDRGSRGERMDTSAQVIRELVDEELHGEIVDYRVVPDEIPDIAAAIVEMTDYYQVNLVLTTGGIGLGPRDVTPEATLKVLERLAPGFSEAMRSKAMQRLPESIYTRGVSGIRGRSLVINLPGSPEEVHLYLDVILSRLPAALAALAGHEEVGHP